MIDPGRPSSGRRLLACVAVAVAIHTLAVVASLAFPARSGYVAKGKNFAFDDIVLYHGFASPILEGRWPYRDYPVEYPILSIPVFAAPLVAGRDFSTYKYAFVVEMLLVNALLTYLLARRVEASAGIGQVPRRLAWYSAFFLCSARWLCSGSTWCRPCSGSPPPAASPRAGWSGAGSPRPWEFWSSWFPW